MKNWQEDLASNYYGNKFVNWSHDKIMFLTILFWLKLLTSSSPNLDIILRTFFHNRKVSHRKYWTRSVMISADTDKTTLSKQLCWLLCNQYQALSRWIWYSISDAKFCVCEKILKMRLSRLWHEALQHFACH